VELMVALAIFAVLALGVFQTSRFFQKNAKTSVVFSANLEDSANLLYRIRSELRKTHQLNFPPLKVNSKELSFYIENDYVQYKFEKGQLTRKVGLEEKVLMKGLEEAVFLRQEHKLMQIQFIMGKEFVITRVYMENL